MSTAARSASHRRVRLSPAARKEQILDAALVEFSAHGFGAASVEKIARRAQLSKAGVYAHFSSKDEIFEALLMKVLQPPFTGKHWRPEEGQTLAETVDAFIDSTYAKCEDPTVVAVLRLLIAESGRAPNIIQRWRVDVLQPFLDGQQNIIEQCVAERFMRPSALTEFFAIAVSPALQTSVMHMIFGDDIIHQDIAGAKEAHRRLLLDLLEVR